MSPLRASAQLLEPEPLDAMHEDREEREAGRNGKIPQPPANDRPQPKGYVLRVVVPASAQRLADPLQRPLHPFRLGFPPETEPSLPRGSAVMREPEKGKGFWPTLAAGAAVRHGEPAELDAAGLVRVEGQTEPIQSRLKIDHKALRVCLMLESDHESSRPGESHPGALSEPCVNLSAHTALPMQPSRKGTELAGQTRSSRQRLPRPSSPHGPPPSLQSHYRTFRTTTRWSAPVPRIGTLPLAGPPLAVLPSHRGDRFPRSVQEPGSRSGRLHAGCRPDSKQVPSGLVPG